MKGLEMKKAELIFRFIGLIVFAIIGFILVAPITELLALKFVSLLPYQVGAAAVLGFIGFLVFPYISMHPVLWIRSYLSKISGQTLLFALIGLVIGLILAALVTIPISQLPSPFKEVLPFVAVLIFGYLGIAISESRSRDFGDLFKSFRRQSRSSTTESPTRAAKEKTILMDTSVIIDGRIVDIARTGFLPGGLLIPRFVLNELQYVADSAENLRRQRGRRGMDVVAQLQKDKNISVTVVDLDVEGVRDVDEKLISLARQMRIPILTNDFNLNKIAELQGVHVLNINDLANAVKSILMPGEMLPARVIQEGKEVGQGVAYLDDGTMVVIEEGQKLLNQEINVVVSKVLQTAAGRMIFAKPANNDLKEKKRRK
jgi:uncharacterized protein YacL